MLKICLGALASAAAAGCAEDALPALGAQQNGVSVSGLSAGAYMAGQFHLAHSEPVAGAGLVAGGPWACALSRLDPLNPFAAGRVAQNLNRALNGCSRDALAPLGVPDVDRLARTARNMAANGRIDSLAGLKGDRIYLYHGQQDRTVARSLTEKAAAFYRAAGVAAGDIALVEGRGAGHGFATRDTANACGASASPFLNDCDYDQAGAILKHIYRDLAEPAAGPAGKFLVFGQGRYARASGHGLAEEGVVYVPATCARTPGCRVHIVFHGCRQGREAVGDAFIEGSGFARWADANRLLVLFPQVAASAFNPQGCWDWWGYTGPDYLGRAAPQIAAVRAMLARLAER